RLLEAGLVVRPLDMRQHAVVERLQTDADERLADVTEKRDVLRLDFRRIDLADQHSPLEEAVALRRGAEAVEGMGIEIEARVHEERALRTRARHGGELAAQRLDAATAPGRFERAPLAERAGERAAAV